MHHQVTENNGYLFDDNIISSDTKQKTRAFKYYRQHYVDCIHKPQGWAVPNTFTNSHGNLDSSVRQWGVHSILQSKLLQPTTVREHQTITTGCFTLNSFHNKIGCGAHTQYTDLQSVSTHNSRVLTVIQLAAREQFCPKIRVLDVVESQRTVASYSPKVASPSKISETADCMS